MPKDTGPFKHGEKVLVPHTDKFYSARVTKSNKREDGIWYYLIHYLGWNKQWDEWVEAPGLHKWDPKLVEGAEVKEGDTPGQRGGKAASKRPEKRRKVVDIAPPEAELPGDDIEPAVELRLPAALKQILVDEHEAFEKGKALPPLPRKPTIGEIMAQYVDESLKARQTADLEDQVGSQLLTLEGTQAATGLRMYFDKAVLHFLLYDHEVKECEKVLASGVVPSSIYGGEHLLRLCSKLPYLIPISSAPPEGYAILQDQLAAFVAFLGEHQKEFFTPTSSYIKLPL